MRRNMLRRLLRPPENGRAVTSGGNGVRIVGLLSSASGLGVSARLCAEQLASGGFSVSAVDVAPLFGASDGIPYGEQKKTLTDEAVTLYHLNPPKLLPGILRAGLRRYYRSFNVGYWAWELETLPEEWIDAIRYVDAIMVPSEFCRAAVERYTGKPICVVPHPLSVETPLPPRRHCDGAPFTVLAMLNFGSSFIRKNPHAALRAFRLAFGADSAARLIFKTSGGHRYPLELGRLRAEAADLANVEVIDEVWSAHRLQQLYRDADVYLSLHRSEGYGLTIAEAMLMECPVVVTGWSGNMDFCGEETAHLVDYRLIDFEDGDPSYEGVTHARWAEPSVAHAARLLRLLREAPEAGRRKAATARRALIGHMASHSYEQAIRWLVDAQADHRRARLEA
jgi:glycosyltransferase involved in cell wall biosynthesis